MELEHQPRVSRRGQNLPALGHCVHAGLTEHVREDSQALARYARNHLVDHEIDVLAPQRRRFSKLERDFVRAEEGRHESRRHFRGQSSDDAKNLELVLERETVPRLYLDRAHAEGREAIYAPSRELEKVSLAAPANVPD